MKKEILEALKAKFTGVSEKILDRIADKLAKTVTKSEEVATAVEGVTFQSVLEAYGDSRATEATQTAVANYEKKHNIKDGKPIEGGGKKDEPQPPAGGGEDTPAWAKQLIEQNKTLTDRLNKMESEKTATTRRQKLSEITKSLPETLRKAYERTPVETLSDEEFSALATEVQTEVAAIGDDMKAKGAVFGQPNKGGAGGSGGGGNKQATDEELEAVANKFNI